MLVVKAAIITIVTLSTYYNFFNFIGQARNYRLNVVVYLFFVFNKINLWKLKIAFWWDALLLTLIMYFCKKILEVKVAIVTVTLSTNNIYISNFIYQASNTTMYVLKNLIPQLFFFHFLFCLITHWVASLLYLPSLFYLKKDVFDNYISFYSENLLTWLYRKLCR